LEKEAIDILIPIHFKQVNATLKSYALWDLYAEYGFSKNKIKLFADLRNILDSKYTEISGFKQLVLQLTVE
jgi:vitamin B12 transporter